MALAIEFVGRQARDAVNQQRGFIAADELGNAIYQASNAVFGYFAGHQSLLRPGQPIPPAAYGLNDPINTALSPFIRYQEYTYQPAAGQLTWADAGDCVFLGSYEIAESFQRLTALFYPGARRVREVNENALAAALANSVTAPTLKYPLRSPIRNGLRVLPGPNTPGAPPVITMQYLCAPPRCIYAEMPDPNNELEMVYDEQNSRDIGWIDVTAINLIIAVATILLGGQVKDQLAIGLASQTIQRGA